MIKKIFKLTVAMHFAVPLLAFAQGATGNIIELGDWGMELLSLLMLLLASLGTAIFIYGAFQFGTSGSNEAKREHAKRLMINSIIGIAFIAFILGFVNIVYNSFDFSSYNAIEPVSSNVPV